jgi:hypothetical protein
MPQNPSTGLVSREELESFLDDQGLRPRMGALLADRQYALPSRRWIQGVFTPFWKDLCSQLDIHKYAPERNDCDKSARLASAWAAICHARTPGAPVAGLAFGEFWYVKDNPIAAHALCLAVTRNDSGGLALSFFEAIPVIAGLVELSPTEIVSCTAYRI